MIRFLLTSFFLLFGYVSIYGQDLDSLIIDTTLTDIELEFQDSITTLNQQNELLSNSRKSYNNGLILFNDGNFSAATVQFTDAIDIDSSFSQAYFYRGKCYQELDMDSAISDYRMAFYLDSTNLLPLYNLAKVQSASDFNEAINTYHSIISFSNLEFRAYYEIGVLLYLQDDIQGAIQAFTNSINTNKDPRTFNDRASCYRIMNKDDLAVNDYISAIDLNPGLAFVYNNLASLYRKQGEFEKALDYYSFAINKDKDYVLAYNNRGGLYLDLGDMQNALKDINQAISIDDHYAPAYNNKGVLLHSQKKYTKALSCFDKAITLDDDYAKAYLNRGITRQMTRDEDGACNDWMKSKQLGISVANKYLGNDCN